MAEGMRDEVRLFYKAKVAKGAKPEIAAVETVIFYMDQYRYDRDRASGRLDAAERAIEGLESRLATLEARE